MEQLRTDLSRATAQDAASKERLEGMDAALKDASERFKEYKSAYSQAKGQLKESVAKAVQLASEKVCVLAVQTSFQ